MQRANTDSKMQGQCIPDVLHQSRLRELGLGLEMSPYAAGKGAHSCQERSGSFLCFVIWVRAVIVQAHLLQPDFRAEQIPARGTRHWCCSPSPFHGCWLWVQIPKRNFGSVPRSKGNIPLFPPPGALSTPCRSPCPEQGVWTTPHPASSSQAAVHMYRTAGESPGECPRQCDNSPCAQEAPSCHGDFQPEPYSNSQSLQEQMERDFSSARQGKF